MKTIMFSLQLSACDLSFLQVLLGMLLPFLLGLGLGWLIWARYKKMMEDLRLQLQKTNNELATAHNLNGKLESEVTGHLANIDTLNGRNRSLSTDLDLCRDARTKLEGELSSAKADHEAYVTKSKTDYEALEATSKENSEMLSKTKADHDNAMAKLKADHDAVVSKSEAAAALSAASGSSNEELDKLKGELSSANNAMAKIKGDLENCQSKTGDLEKSNADLQTKLEEANRRASELEDQAKNALKSTSGLGAAGAALGGAVASKLTTEDNDVDRSEEAIVAPVVSGAVKEDDLTRVEGIGPKIAGLFNDDGIHTWSQLAGKDPADLKAILEKAGSRYQMHDPGTWPAQAQLLADGDTEKLNEYQDYLIGGRDPKNILAELSGQEPDLNAGTAVLGHKVNMNDLKLVEGIGPKIEELLNGAGINTWAGLGMEKVSRLNEILTAAGPRFALAKPNTWPKQATLAALGKWSELKKLQDVLDGGKE